MNKEDLGKHFIKDNVVYEAIGYTDLPTMELINRETGNRLSVVIGSDYANEFELVPEDKKIEYLDLDDLNKIIDTYSKEYTIRHTIHKSLIEIKGKINELVEKVNGE